MLIIIARYKPWLATVALMTIVFIANVNTAMGQGSSAFTYQGRLTDDTLPSTGVYDFQFGLFDALTDGTEVIAPIDRLGVQVTDGAFTVLLDFGFSAFTGQDRFLEIRVRQPGEIDFRRLAPRRQIMATPHALYSFTSGYSYDAQNAVAASRAETATTAENALQLGGAAPNQYVRTNDPRFALYVQMINERAPIAGSPNYIQNSTASQPAANFNISGNGVVGGSLTGAVVNAITQYNLGNTRVLSGPGSFNFFAGVYAGDRNTTGSNNSFFGTFAGRANTSGSHNAFFGAGAGENNTTGADNSYFGWWAGKNSETGVNNAFFGVRTGQDNAHGDNNSFFGYRSGLANTTGSGNSLFGAYTDVSAHNLTNATAVGARAYVSRSNALVLGQIAGVNGATSDTNVGIGVTAPLDRLHVNGTIRVETLGQAGSQSLCRNAKQQISTCSSSLRYKTALAPFRDGLSLVNRLNPISFTWKDGGARDLGLGAEDVAAVEPLLVIRNDKGEVEGVKYDRIALILLNAVKEQQELINKQQQQIDALRKFVCQNNPQAESLHTSSASPTGLCQPD